MYIANTPKIDQIFRLSLWSSITYRNFPFGRWCRLGDDHDPLGGLGSRL